MLTVTLITFCVSAAWCFVYLQLALRWQLLDLPNHRSSHDQPTPHGGGVPTMLALLCGLGIGFLWGWEWPAIYAAGLAVSSGLVLVGVVDDIHGLPVGLRFALYACACVLLLLLLYGAPGSWMPMQWLAMPLLLLGLLWLLNLYNFMDGIDGLAATQCILATSTAAGLAGWQQAAPVYAMACLLLAAAHAGFLLWNWSPARMFMGDAGSVPTGFLLGLLALWGGETGYLPVACWLILLAAFVTDATVTLIARACRGEKLTDPHRTHAYQKLSRYFGAHRPVVLLLLAIHVLWLAPLALLAASFPAHGISLVILAYIPLTFGMAKAARLG